MGMIRYGSLPGTNRGGTGRPPDAFKAFLRDALAQPEADEMLQKILRGESFIHRGKLVLVDGDLWAKTFAWATERVYGKAMPDLSAAGGGKALLFRVVGTVRAAG